MTREMVNQFIILLTCVNVNILFRFLRWLSTLYCSFSHGVATSKNTGWTLTPSSVCETITGFGTKLPAGSRGRGHRGPLSDRFGGLVRSEGQGESP